MNIPWGNYLVPRRTVLLITRIPDNHIQFREVFVGYRCRDCGYFTADVQQITDHQQLWYTLFLKNLWEKYVEMVLPDKFKAKYYGDTWHGWKKALARMMDS